MTLAPLGHPHFLEALSLPVHHRAFFAPFRNTSQLMVLHPFDEMIVSISASQRMPYILKLFEGSLLVPVLKMSQVNLAWELGSLAWEPWGVFFRTAWELCLGAWSWKPCLITLLDNLFSGTFQNAHLSCSDLLRDLCYG